MQKAVMLLFVLVVGACAVPSRHFQGLTTLSRDSASHGGHEFETLALAMLIVLVLIPIVTRRR